MERGRPVHSCSPGDRVGADCPPRQDAERKDEEQSDHRGAERERRPAPVPQLHDPRAPSRSGRAAVDGAAQPEAGGDEHEHERERDEHEGENRRRLECEQRLVADVDARRQRRVPHQRDDAEVGEDVQSDEQRRSRDGRAKRRQGHEREHARAARAEAARGLLRRGIDASQTRRREEVHVRKRGERERDERSPVAGHLREAIDSDRLEHLLDETTWGERSEQGERCDEARDDERKRRREAPQPPSRQIGADDEPGERHADDERRDDDAEREDRRVPRQLERGGERGESAGALVGRERPQREIGDGEDCSERDEAGCCHEQPWRAAAA